jgi:hypothetical protein
MGSDAAGEGMTSADRAQPSWRASVIAWSLLILMMMGVTAVISFSLPDARPWRPLLIHLAASIPISATHIVGMGVVRWLLAGSLIGAYDPFWPLRNGVYEYRKDLLTYGAILVFCWGWRAWQERARSREAQAPEGRAEARLGADADPAPLEVRDGARRHFVRPADIVWAEAAGNYVALKLEGRELLMRTPLAALEARLEAAGFVRIHRSRLVNRTWIASVASTAAGDFTVTLRDGRTLAGSRRHRQAISRAMPS